MGDEKNQMNEEKKVTPAAPDINQILSEPVGGSDTIAKPKSTRTMWRIIIGAAIAVVVAIVLLVGITALGIYRFNWQDQFTTSVAKTLHLPVALIGWDPVSYSTFKEDVGTLHFFYEAQAASGTTATTTVPADSFLDKSVVSRLIREKFVADSATQHDLTVSQSDIDSEYSAIVQQAGSEDQVISALKSLYDWDPATFKTKVLEPYLERTKLQEYVATDATINADAKKKAEDVLALVKKGDQTFEDLAKQYSEDSTASSGGDLGYFGAGDMVQPFEDAVKALEVGQVSDIVQTVYGFHIIKLLDHTAATADKPEQWHAEHILIKAKDIDEWINEQLAEKGVKVLLAGMEWKTDCGLVLGTSETCDNNEILNAASTGTTPADTDTNTNTDTTDSNTNVTNGDANTNQ